MELRWVANSGGYFMYDKKATAGCTSKVSEGNEPQGWTTVFYPTGGGMFWLDRMPTKEQAKLVVETAYRLGLRLWMWQKYPGIGKLVCSSVLQSTRSP